MRNDFKYIGFIIVVVLLASCKKDYICTCKVKYTQVNNPNYGNTTTFTINMKSVTKKTAKRNCISSTAKFSNSQDYIIQDCKLQ